MAKLGHRGNGHGHKTETPDVSHVRNPDVTYEMSDVNVPGILKFVAALVVMTVVVYVLMWLLFGFFNAQEARKDSETAAGPMAMTEKENLPPEPRLQAARGFGVKLEDGQWVNLENREPQAEYRVLHEEWERELKEGRKEPSGNAGLPIEQAMQKVVEGQGLPSRPQQPAPQQMAADTSGPPTAASSGRVSQKGRE